jgi:flagellar protein FlaG
MSAQSIQGAGAQNSSAGSVTPDAPATQTQNTAANRAAYARAASAEAARASAPDVSEAKVAQASEQLNRVMSAFHKGIRFQLHEDLDRPYVQIVNQETKEVVKSIPPEEMLDVMARLHRVLGMILDTEV